MVDRETANFDVESSILSFYYNKVTLNGPVD